METNEFVEVLLTEERSVKLPLIVEKFVVKKLVAVAFCAMRLFANAFVVVEFPTIRSVI